MKEERLDELLWERFDQAIRPEDREALEEHLRGNPEARAQERQLDEFVATLATLEDVEPPPALRRRIDVALADLRRSTDSRWDSASWVEAFRDLWSPRPLLRYAAIAAAFLVGALSYHLLTAGAGSSRIDPAKFYGSTGLARQDSPTRAWTLELPGERGWLALQRQGSLLISEIAFSFEGEGELAVLFSGGGFRLETIEHSGSPPSRLHTTAEALHLELMGPSRYTLTTALAHPDQKIRIRLSTRGAEPLERELRFDDLPGI